MRTALDSVSRIGEAGTAVRYWLDGREEGKGEVGDKKTPKLQSQKSKEDLERTTFCTLVFFCWKK